VENFNGSDMPDLSNLSLDDIEAELKKFEAEERKRLGLDAEQTDHWYDAVPSTFTAKQRAHTTVLVCGLTMAHDLFIQSALRGIGYNVVAMDVPDNAALQYGREFGNRGQCNPTYFTVGNLVKYLSNMRDNGMSTEDIVKNHVFVTAGACGPCRFGTYVTEYRKALRDSGFDGFRVLLFQQTGGLKQATGEEIGLQMNPTFFWGVIRAVMIGDVLNALAYRIRPYEVEPGATDRAMAAAKNHIAMAFESNTSMMRAMYRARKVMGSVAIDRTKPKPKVAIIGEFWAMTTEGDGNYGLQKFLENEGAEVEIQLVTAWLLYMLWQAKYDTDARAKLRGVDKGGPEGSKFSLAGVDVRKKLITLAAAEKLIRSMFQVMANALGLRDYHLTDMDTLAEISHEFYDNNLRGGEGHMEVGKLIQNVVKNKVNMTLSVKPFGCMPSSSVSDGVQSMITELHPGAIFLPIETNGDGAVNVYSRVQMQLFKAKQLAAREQQAMLDKHDLTLEEVQLFIKKNPKYGHAFHRSPHAAGCTSADLIAEIAQRKSRLGNLKARTFGWYTKRRAAKAERARLAKVAKIAGEKARARASAASVIETVEEQEIAIDNGRPAIPEGRKSLKVLN
jgi:predicted nucleotide-binding protein (sugar kinase/HSP70/actin superfamily)